MDDISEKLAELLNDPSGMEKIKGMAQSLLFEEKPKENEEVLPADLDIGAITRVLGMMKQGSNDDSRVRLLLALKPNLSPDRQAKVDSAIKILKLIELAPLLGDLGLFSL